MAEFVPSLIIVIVALIVALCIWGSVVFEDRQAQRNRWPTPPEGDRP